MRKTNFRFLAFTVLATFTLILTGCPDGVGSKAGSGPDRNETAATVNGTAIKLQEVERLIKQQAKGQEARLSQLELTQARLQVLEQLIQQAVLYQKAEGEQTIPTEEEVTAALNKMKTGSGVSQEAFAKRMKEAGETEKTLRSKLKKQLAIEKLVDKISGKVEAPKDNEIEAFYNGNKEAFVKKRGVKLAAIVVDPRNNGEGDLTPNEAAASQKLKDISQKLSQGTDFATVARQESEDASKIRGGDLGYLSEEQLKQNYPQLAVGFMNPEFAVGGLAGPVNIAGRFFIFKLQERVEKEEKQTLESPGVRKQITDSLVNTRKQLLSTSYAAIAMNEAKVENYLAKKVVENPNELSGARPVATATTTTDSASNSNSGSNSSANSKKDNKKLDKTSEKKSKK